MRQEMRNYLLHRRKHHRDPAVTGPAKVIPVAPILDTLEIDSSIGEYNGMDMLTDALAVVIYRGGAGMGNDELMIQTVSVDGTYQISTVDKITAFANISARRPSVCALSGTKFVVAFQDHAAQDAIVRLYSCDVDGDNITYEAMLVHDTSGSKYNSLCKVDSLNFMLSYTDGGWDGMLKTFSISLNGSWAITEEDSYEYDATYSYYSSLAKLGGSYYVVAYSGSGDDAYIKTFDISGGIDDIQEVDSIEHDTSLGEYCSVCVFSATNFAVAYRGANNYGYVKTFSVTAVGDDITLLGVEVHDVTNSKWHSLVTITNRAMFLAYSGTGDDGFVKTFYCDSNWNITMVDYYEFDSTEATHCVMAQLDDEDHYLLIYTDTDTDVQAITVKIEDL
jgi:hypothetical protein